MFDIRGRIRIGNPILAVTRHHPSLNYPNKAINWCSGTVREPLRAKKLGRGIVLPDNLVYLKDMKRTLIAKLERIKEIASGLKKKNFSSTNKYWRQGKLITKTNHAIRDESNF